MKMNKKEESNTSVVLGTLGIIFAVLFAPVGLILGIVGLVIDKPKSKRKKAIKLNVIAIILSVVLPLLFLIIITMTTVLLRSASGI